MCYRRRESYLVINSRSSRPAFTIVELLVVVSIIGILVAVLMPALHVARESARKASCMSNLRQFGIVIQQHADRHRGFFCTGAFDWRRDGAVTETGWVSDLVELGTPVGDMLCPSNPNQISETYIDLLSMDAGSADCVDLAGPVPKTAPDGSLIVNPCRKIIDGGLAPNSEERRLIVEKEILQKFYNTNYAASWYLVRSYVAMDSSGNLSRRDSKCPASLLSLNSTRGPLRDTLLDAANFPTSSVPWLADAASGLALPMDVGIHTAGNLTAKSFSSGPVQNPSMQFPTFSDGTSRNGPTGWWGVWNKTMQDYRAFGPMHRGVCNILFADGGVRGFRDVNEDGVLNNGFESSVENGFADNTIEMPPESVASTYTLR